MKHHKNPKELFTDIFFEEQLLASIKRAKSEISNILISLKHSSAVLSYNGQIVTAQPVDFTRLLAEWNSTTSVDHVVRNIVNSALFSAEEKCAGSALIAAGAWVSGLKPTLGTFTKRCRHTELIDCLTFFGGGGMSRHAAERLIDLVGIGCRVDYQEHSENVTKITAHSGKEFGGYVDHLFGDRVGRTFDISNCLVVAIQGTVETVSSLHFLIESSVERPVLVMAENFLPDVANTLAETWKRERGKCIPFVVKTWPHGNFLEMEKFGILCVSQERGDTISSLKLECQNGSNISLAGETCVISGSQNEGNFKLTVLVSQALGGLTGLAKDRIKMLLGFARHCARSGVVKWEMFSKSSSSFLELYSESLAISSQSLVTGVKASESLERVLQNLGCVILFQQGETK